MEEMRWGEDWDVEVEEVWEEVEKMVLGDVVEAVVEVEGLEEA